MQREEGQGRASFAKQRERSQGGGCAPGHHGHGHNY